MRLLAAVIGVFMVLTAGSARSAPTVAVGTCTSAHPVYATIQQAVNSSPTNSTILVCPGVYPEQVTINKNLTLRGLAINNQDQAVIAAPSSGVVVNAIDADGGDPIAAQIAVTAGTSVTIANLTIDGSGNGIAQCGMDLVGVLFQSASGAIGNSEVINQTLPSGYTGCQDGLAILVQTASGQASTVAMSGNTVSGFQKNGITGNDTGTALTITNNSVIGQGPTGGAAENSIQVAFGATASVVNNVVGDDVWAPDTFGDTGDAAAGILVYDSANVKVSSNVVGNTQYGIAIVSDGSASANGATVTMNRIQATHLYDAIDVCGSSGSTVMSNTVRGSDESAIHIDSSCGPASTNESVAENILNGGCAGILVGAGSDEPTGSNNYFNVATEIMTGSDVCQSTTPQTAARQLASRGKHRHFSPVR